MGVQTHRIMAEQLPLSRIQLKVSLSDLETLKLPPEGQTRSSRIPQKNPSRRLLRDAQGALVLRGGSALFERHP